MKLRSSRVDRDGIRGPSVRAIIIAQSEAGEKAEGSMKHDGPTCSVVECDGQVPRSDDMHGKKEKACTIAGKMRRRECHKRECGTG